MNFDFRLEFRKREDLSPDLVTDGVFEAVEVVGAELITGWNNLNFDTFTSTGAVINSAIGDGSAAEGCFSNTAVLTEGKTYKLVLTPDNLTTAEKVDFRVSTQTNLNAAIFFTPDLETGASTFYFTVPATDTYYFGYRGTSGTASNFDVPATSAKLLTLTSWTDTADGLAPGTDGAGALTNKASWDGSQVAASQLIQSDILTPGALARIVYTPTRSAGTMTAKCGTASGTSRNSAATYTEDIMCAGNGNLIFEADASFVGTVDVVSAKVIN